MTPYIRWFGKVILVMIEKGVDAYSSFNRLLYFRRLADSGSLTEAFYPLQVHSSVYETIAQRTAGIGREKCQKITHAPAPAEIAACRVLG